MLYSPYSEVTSSRVIDVPAAKKAASKSIDALFKKSFMLFSLIL